MLNERSKDWSVLLLAPEMVRTGENHPDKGVNVPPELELEIMLPAYTS